MKYYSSKSINEICQTCVNYLRPIKEVLNGSLLSFFAIIHQVRPDQFDNHSKLLEHLRDELLPICDLGRGYKFQLYFFSDESSHTNVIDQILQMPQVDRSSNVKFELDYYSPRNSTQLPIKAISNWLHRTYDDIKNIGQTQTKRCLKIATLKIQNATEMFDHIKEVFLHILERINYFDDNVVVESSFDLGKFCSVLASVCCSSL